jgi:hypothetical protein
MMTAQPFSVNPGNEFDRSGSFEEAVRMFPKTQTLLISLLALAILIVPVQAQTIHISGPSVTPTEISAADLAAMPRLSVDVQNSHNGQTEHYEGVRISDLLAKAGAPLGDKLRGRAMATYVRALASDGYSVVYSLAELDPAFHDNQIIVADRMNGKPLEAKEGPFKAVVPGDKRPARWIRMLVELKVENASPSEAAQPATMK